jgi:2-C-methyl-D-erythritol 2,4-cyclodiphosphate synthase
VTAVRTGVGYDSHRFAPGGPLILGGVRMDAEVHLLGHSDADAVAHALTDAILGAAGLGDIGELFPDTDSANEGRDSIEMLALAAERVHVAGWRVANVDIVVIAQSVRIAPHRASIRGRLAGALSISESAISIKGKTNEGMGWIGTGEGLACIAVTTLTATNP